MKLDVYEVYTRRQIDLISKMLYEFLDDSLKEAGQKGMAVDYEEIDEQTKAHFTVWSRKMFHRLRDLNFFDL